MCVCACVHVCVVFFALTLVPLLLFALLFARSLFSFANAKRSGLCCFGFAVNQFADREFEDVLAMVRSFVVFLFLVSLCAAVALFIRSLLRVIITRSHQTRSTSTSIPSTSTSMPAREFPTVFLLPPPLLRVLRMHETHQMQLIGELRALLHRQGYVCYICFDF